MPKCGQCNGYGYRDDGDACYHCSNTGKLNEEQAYADRVDRVIRCLAADASVLDRNEDNKIAQQEDGEDWAFRAAENGCSEREYVEGRIILKEAEIHAACEKLPRNALRVIVDTITGVLDLTITVTKPTRQPSPYGTAPPLMTDPRRIQCSRHGAHFPGEVCKADGVYL